MLVYIYIYIYIHIYIHTYIYIYYMSDIKLSLTIHVAKVGPAFKHVAGKETTLVFCQSTCIVW